MSIQKLMEEVIRTDLAWMKRAQCQGMTHLFFAPLKERPNARDERESLARAICADCPAQTPCQAYGREHHQYGIWGGENEEQRVTAGISLNAPIGVRRRPLHSAHV